MTAPSSSSHASAFEWALLGVVTIIGGSAFAMIRVAVETMPPAAISAGRIWIGALFLYLVMKQAGRRLPPLLAPSKRRVRRGWPSMIFVGVVGNAIPFLLFPWAQERVPSGLAGVYMAFMPIWTLGLAYLFASEKLTPAKIVGFAFGLVGVLILMGPDALACALKGDLKAQGALLLATLCYAASAVATRRAPSMRPRAFAAGMAISAAIAATPALFFIDLQTDEWSLRSVAAVIGLGLLPTGLNGVLIIMLIRRAGAGFFALTNYMTPLWAVAVGWILFAERLPANVWIALAVILSGVAISRRKSKAKAPVPAAAETPPARA